MPKRSSDSSTIYVPEPLTHQVEPLEDNARFKVWPWGRRAGKTRGAMIAGLVGHGKNGERKGFLNQGHTLWLARDYTQARTIWYKEIKPRFSNKQGLDVSEKWKTVSLEDMSGSFRVASSDNIDSERGDNWDGVVIDEAAFVDLEYIFKQVIRPGLADTLGWCLIMGTTFPGSYFNELCLEVERGERPGWHLSERTAADNPKISDAEFKQLVEDYAGDEVALDCEVYAKRTVRGGFAFPEWDPKQHVKKVVHFSDAWLPVGTMDWGYVKPGWFGYARVGPEGHVYFRYDYKFVGMEPKDVGKAMGGKIKAFSSLPEDNPDFHPIPLYIVADAQMWMKSESAVTVADQVSEGLREVLGDLAPSLVRAIKGPESRTIGKVMVHQHLKVPEKDGKPDPNNPPKLRFHPDCAYPAKQFPLLPRDPTRLEDVDTKKDDHFYDGVRYLLTMQKPVADVADRKSVRAPHADAVKRRRDRREKALREAMGYNTPGGIEYESVEPEEFWRGQASADPNL